MAHSIIYFCFLITKNIFFRTALKPVSHWTCILHDLNWLTKYIKWTLSYIIILLHWKHTSSLRLQCELYPVSRIITSCCEHVKLHVYFHHRRRNRYEKWNLWAKRAEHQLLVFLVGTLTKCQFFGVFSSLYFVIIY